MIRTNPFPRRRHEPSKRSRRLHLEPLEPRVALSAAPLDVSAAWRSPAALIGPRPNPSLPAQHAAPVLATFPRTPAAPTTPAEPFGRFQSPADLKNYLLAGAVQQYASLFGTSVPGYGYCSPGTGVIYSGFTMNAGGAVSLAATNTTAAAAYSTTNTQVAGVEEADLMETDGNYLYMLSQGELVIVDVRNVDQPAIAARLKLPDPASSMYLSGDRLTLVSSGYGYLGSSGLMLAEFYQNPAETTVTVVDVSDRSAPKIVSRTQCDGSLVDSRAVGSRVYLVLQDTDSLSLPSPMIVNSDGSAVTVGAAIRMAPAIATRPNRNTPRE